MIDLLIKAGIFIVSVFLSLILSGLLIRKGIPRIKKNNGIGPDHTGTQKKGKVFFLELGFLIGFFETLIIFVFVINKEFSALAIIFGAKEFVRKEQIKADPTYYLLGTFINFAVALIMAELSIQAITILL
jgi:hypothetical protein